MPLSPCEGEDVMCKIYKYNLSDNSVFINGNENTSVLHNEERRKRKLLFGKKVSVDGVDQYLYDGHMQPIELVNMDDKVQIEALLDSGSELNAIDSETVAFLDDITVYYMKK